MKTTPTVAELIKQQAQTTTNGLDNKTATYNQSLSLLDLTEFDMGSLDPGMESVINSVLNESPEDGQSKSPHPEDAPKLPAALSDRLESSIAWIKKVMYILVQSDLVNLYFFNPYASQSEHTSW